jgi:hypothetical protein
MRSRLTVTPQHSLRGNIVIIFPLLFRRHPVDDAILCLRRPFLDQRRYCVTAMPCNPLKAPSGVDVEEQAKPRLLAVNVFQVPLRLSASLAERQCSIS